MKTSKKIISIIIVFVIIQAISMIFVPHKTYAYSFFEKLFSDAKKFDEEAERNAGNSIDVTEITNVTDDFYNAVRAIGVGIFMVDIAFTAVAISNKNNGKDIAGAKTTIVVTVALAILFIFAEQFIGLLTTIAELAKAQM